MKNIYFFSKKADRNSKEKSCKKNGLHYQLSTNKKHPITQFDQYGNEYECPYEITVFLDWLNGESLYEDKEKSLENLNEALDLLKKELNDETNGITKRERRRLDTVISKLIILIETIYYKRGKWHAINTQRCTNTT